MSKSEKWKKVRHSLNVVEWKWEQPLRHKRGCLMERILSLEEQIRKSFFEKHLDFLTSSSLVVWAPVCLLKPLFALVEHLCDLFELAEGQRIVSSTDDAKFQHKIELVNLVLGGMAPSSLSKYVSESKNTITMWVKSADEKGFGSLRAKGIRAALRSCLLMNFPL